MKEILAMLFVLGLLIVLPIWGLFAFSKSQSQQSCFKYGETSGYQTRYIEYTFFNYDCLAKTKSGKWISTSLLREVD